MSALFDRRSLSEKLGRGVYKCGSQERAQTLPENGDDWLESRLKMERRNPKVSEGKAKRDLQCSKARQTSVLGSLAADRKRWRSPDRAKITE